MAPGERQPIPWISAMTGPTSDSYAVRIANISPGSSVLLPPLEAAAASFGVQATVAHFHDAAEIERAIGASAREPNVGLLVLAGSLALLHRARGPVPVAGDLRGKYLSQKRRAHLVRRIRE